MKLALALFVALPVVWGQTFSSPVRDVENPDKNIVSTGCQFDFTGSALAEILSCQADFPATKPVVLTSVDLACHSAAPTDRFRRFGSIWSISTGLIGFSSTGGIGGSFDSPVISDLVEQGAHREGLRILVRLNNGVPTVFATAVRVKQSVHSQSGRCTLRAFGYVAP